MKIRFIKQWRRKPIGTELEMPDGVANLLVRRKFAERWDAPPPEERPLETAALAGPSETRVKKSRKKDQDES